MECGILCHHNLNAVGHKVCTGADLDKILSEFLMND